MKHISYNIEKVTDNRYKEQKKHGLVPTDANKCQCTDLSTIVGYKMSFDKSLKEVFWSACTSDSYWFLGNDKGIYEKEIECLMD